MHLPASLLATLTTFLIPASAFTESLLSNNASLLWGPYRPNVYLGIRPRLPDGLRMGMMWGNVDEGEKNLRYTCSASDSMASYGWTEYDARTGGTQFIDDEKNHLNLTVDFIKKSGGQSAGNWALRVIGMPRENAPAGLKTSVVFYVGMEGMESCADCKLESSVDKVGNGDDLAIETVDMKVEHPRLGTAKVHFPSPKHVDGKGVHLNTAVKSMKVKNDKIWQEKSLFLDILYGKKKGESKDLIPNEPGPGNMHFVQYHFQDPFSFNVLYSTQSATTEMTPKDLERDIVTASNSFKKSYSAVFPPKAPFDSDSHITFGHTMLSNLLGGLSYFYGDAKVDYSHGYVYQETTAKFWNMAADARKHGKPETRGPYELLTHVPSRSVFPRGFLWDEGFHLLLVMEWDADLAMEVVRSWLSLMNDEGWIAREQILGPEPRSGTPEEFHVQYPQIANPPTLFWVVSNFIDMLDGKTKYVGHESTYLSQPEMGKAMLKELYPLLKKQYQWFRKTQSGDVEAHSIPSANLDEGYRWRGRTPKYTYASGLDDYPRAEPPDISELHLDALCWVGVMAKSLEKFALSTNNSADTAMYQDHLQGVQHNLDAVHWSREKRVFCDTVMRDDMHFYTCPKGYISLFPFLTGFIGPEHARLNAVLDLLRNPDHLWTDYGVRSLSPESTYYGVGDNYWRSPIWININYLIIQQLLSLATTSGPQQEKCKSIYNELRTNLVNTIFSSWQQTGYAWEQYDAFGRGQRTPGFTGWTSLVVKIMAMPDLEEPEGMREKIKQELGTWVVFAKERARERDSAGLRAVIGAVLLMIFLYVTRRRFAGTIRGWRRRRI